jgi:hypothetical protein
VAGKGWRPAAGVSFGAIVLVVFGLILPAVYRAQYEQPGAAAPAAPAAHAEPTAAQRAIFDRHAARKPGLGLSLTGRDGYRFLGDLYQANVSQALGWRHYSAAEVTGTAAVVRDQRTWLTRRHIASSFVVVPAKWDVYADKLPPWTDGLRLPTTFDQLRDFAPDLFPDLRPPLRAARATAETYSRLNSHWSGYGADVGYRAILGAVQAGDPRFADVVPPPAVARTRTVDQFNEFADIHVPGPNDWTEPVYATRLRGYDVLSATGPVTAKAGGDQLDMLSFPLRTRSEAANSHRVLVLGDSATTGVSNLIAESFHDALFVRHHLDQPEQEPNLPGLVAAFKPDLVLTLVSERNLNLPISVQQPQWEAALAYDTAGGPATVPDGAGTIGASGRPISVPPGAGSPLLALTGSGTVPTRITILTGDGTTKLRTFRIGPGDWVIYASLPPAGSFVITSSRPAELESIAVRYL